MKAKMKRTQIAKILGNRVKIVVDVLPARDYDSHRLNEEDFEAIAEEIMALFGVHLNGREKGGGNG